jgi:hypothetical protein
MLCSADYGRVLLTGRAVRVADDQRRCALSRAPARRGLAALGERHARRPAARAVRARTAAGAGPALARSTSGACQSASSANSAEPNVGRGSAARTLSSGIPCADAAERAVVLGRPRGQLERGGEAVARHEPARRVRLADDTGDPRRTAVVHEVRARGAAQRTAFRQRQRQVAEQSQVERGQQPLDREVGLRIVGRDHVPGFIAQSSVTCNPCRVRSKPGLCRRKSTVSGVKRAACPAACCAPPRASVSSAPSLRRASRVRSDLSWRVAASVKRTCRASTVLRSPRASRSSQSRSPNVSLWVPQQANPTALAPTAPAIATGKAGSGIDRDASATAARAPWSSRAVR